jgi:hypothetical protein
MRFFYKLFFTKDNGEDIKKIVVKVTVKIFKANNNSKICRQ